MRQAAHLRCHHREAAPLFAGPRCFDGGIQCQDVGLERDAINHADDVDNFFGRGIDGTHGIDHLLHNVAASERHRCCRCCQLIGLFGEIGILSDGSSQLFHRRRRLFQRAGLFFGARREIQITAGNLAAGSVDGIGARAHILHDLLQTVVHAFHRRHQAGLVVAVGDHPRSQVALRNLVCQRCRISWFSSQLLQQAAHDQGGAGNAG